MLQEKARVRETVLAGLSQVDRDILVRIYLLEQLQEQIIREMSLTEAQFRLYPWHANEKFGEAGGKTLACPGWVTRIHAGRSLRSRF
jgi:hypothetical protein